MHFDTRHDGVDRSSLGIQQSDGGCPNQYKPSRNALRRNLACELGPHGIRVVTLQTAGIVDSIPEDFEGREAIVEATERRTMLKRAATLEDVGNVAAFAASDLARTMTATALNITCGAQVD